VRGFSAIAFVNRFAKPILICLAAKARGQSKVGSEFFLHGSVNHSIGEYVRGDVHANTIEEYFSIMKRGIYGTFHHVSQQHLKRYLAEFDFHYNERSALGLEDAERIAKSVRGIVGKRLTYKDSYGVGPN
jgi:ISXO2-like transposase domain